MNPLVERTDFIIEIKQHKLIQYSVPGLGVITKERENLKTLSYQAIRHEIICEDFDRL